MILKILIAIIAFNGIGIYVQCGPPDNAKQVKTLVEDAGYHFEEHHFPTEDGYIITAYRLFSVNKTEKPKPVALCAHGIMGSGVDWVINGPNVSIGFLLANENYDVWLFNSRGVLNSRKHVKYLETSYKYWDFSAHEIGFYDLPATIDYILKATRQSDLYYVGFSQGCAIMFIMGSLKPEYNQKIRVAALLAPAVYLGGLSGLTQYFFRFSYPLSQLFEKVGHFELYTESSLWRVATNYLCNEHAVTQFLCFGLLFSLTGDGTEQADPASFSKYLTYFPTGVSTKQFFFYGFLNLNPGHFRQYDYGPTENMKVYNSTEPPEYPINKTNIPVAIFQGLNDIISTSSDVDILVKNIPHVIYREMITAKKLNHMDLIYGHDMPKFAYSKILQLFGTYKKNDTKVF